MTSNERPFDLICFDLGGVIIRICRSWSEGCDSAGVDVRHDDDWIQQISPKWSRLIEAYQTGRIPIHTYSMEVSRIFDGLYSPSEVEQIHLSWMHGPYDDCEPIVHDIHDAGLETAAFSNTSHEHWRTINTVDAVRAMRHRHASHLIGLHKPDPAAYRAIEQLTDHAPERILFFDDTEENIDAALSCGWTAELIDPFKPTAPQLRAALLRHGVLVD